MVWIAALYFTASPTAGSSCPMFLFIVLQPPSATVAVAISKSLEDMAIVLFETDGLVLRRSAGRRRWQRRRRSRLNERRRRRRDAGVGAAVEQQIGFVGRADAVGRHLERSGADRTHQPRRDDDHQLGFLVLEAGRAEQRADDRQRAEERNLADRILEILADQPGEREAFAVADLDHGLGAAGLLPPGRPIFFDEP